MAGLFFCLASADSAGLLFCPDSIQPHASVYSGFYRVHAVIPPTPQNGVQGFIGAFHEICYILPSQITDRHKRLYITCATLEHITTTGRPPAHTRYHRHPVRCTGQHSRPIIIRYIRVQGCAPVIDPCQTVQHIADHASPAGSSPAACGLLASADTLPTAHTRCTC